ncbi:MAG: hypothetical protein ACRENA_00610 [Vulcanimicrobiaceae bacterium]
MSGIALGVIAVILIGTVAIGWLAVRNVKQDPTQYIVGGRSLGWVLVWLLMAGEIYTSFTFLGAAGWAYIHGAPAFYILCYGTVAYIISYFMLPPIWRVAKAHGLLTGRITSGRFTAASSSAHGSRSSASSSWFHM